MKPIKFSNTRKFFYDCKAIGGTLVSIGMVGEHESQSLYLCNLDSVPAFKKANSWTKNNIIPQLPDSKSPEWVLEKNLKNLILNFLNPEIPFEFWTLGSPKNHPLLQGVLEGDMQDMTYDVRQVAYHMESEVPGQRGTSNIALQDAQYVKRAYDYLRNLDRFDL